MVIYSIKDLENLTGIKAHTIRIWEKRYGIIEPRRTKTNIRYYLEEDLKRIMNIALLNRNGYKISKIAKLPNDQILSIAAQLTDVDKSFENQLDGLTLSVLELNEKKFLKIFNTNIYQKGFKRTMLEMIYPLLDKLEMMWMTGSVEPIHENFVSHLIKRKCIVETDKIGQDGADAKKFLVYLPKNETGELSLLFLQYLIRSKGHRVVNLGTHIELKNILTGIHLYNPDYILTIFNELSDPDDFSNYLTLLQNETNAKILLGGLQVLRQNQDVLKDTYTFQSSDDLEELLKTLSEVGNTRSEVIN